MCRCCVFGFSCHSVTHLYLKTFSSLFTMSFVSATLDVLALDLEGVHDVKLHHPSSSVATSNQ